MVVLCERFVEEGDQERLAGALGRGEAYDQGWGQGVMRGDEGGVGLFVALEEGEDEGDHMLGFVILDSFWDDCCCHGGVQGRLYHG